MKKNLLYYGDNLQILRDYIKDETIDLIYLDPPFKSNKDYNVLFAEQNGSRSAAQIKAFEDTWEWNTVAAAAYQEAVESGPQRVSQTMQAFRTFLGESDMMAYLAMMAPRLIELHRVLKSSGSIYLHCDQTASAHLRLLMDAVFSPNNFRNEIIWLYRQGGRGGRTFPRKHDNLFWYAKVNKKCFFDPDDIRIPYEGTGGYISTGRNIVGDKEYRVNPKGKIPEDWWDIPALNPMSKERLGYPTQKPEALLERIIKACSKEGDIILDPFCGCGTTIAVAQKLNRWWIGIDITHLAIALMKHRLKDMFGYQADYLVIGEPVSLPDAKTLAANDPYQFQWWALGLVGARPVEQKKGADKGIDGRLYFHYEGDRSKAKTKQIIISVKAGHVSVSHIRDLRGVVVRENAEIGALLTMEKPTKPMRTEAASAGFYDSESWGKFPKIQILTVKELLSGKTLEYHRTSGSNVTFKKAPDGKVKKTVQDEIDIPHE